MDRLIRFTPIAFAVLLLAGCTEDFFETVIDADPPPFSPKVVVHAYCDDNPDRMQVLILEKNRNLFEANDYNDPISDATIEVLENGNPIGTFRNDLLIAESQYGSDPAYLFRTTGATYTLRISAPGFPEATSEQILPAPVPLDDVLYQDDIGVDEDGDRVNGFKITFRDEPTEGDYYLLECTDTLDPSFPVWLSSTDPFVQTTEDGYILITDEGNNGFDQTFEVYSYNVNAQRTYRVTLRHINRELYQYLLAADAYGSSDIEFFTEPVFVPSNIENGLGIFSLSSKTERLARQ